MGGWTRKAVEFIAELGHGCVPTSIFLDLKMSEYSWSCPRDLRDSLYVGSRKLPSSPITSHFLPQEPKPGRRSPQFPTLARVLGLAQPRDPVPLLGRDGIVAYSSDDAASVAFGLSGVPREEGGGGFVGEKYRILAENPISLETTVSGARPLGGVGSTPCDDDGGLVPALLVAAKPRHGDTVRGFSRKAVVRALLAFWDVNSLADVGIYSLSP